VINGQRLDCALRQYYVDVKGLSVYLATHRYGDARLQKIGLAQSRVGFGNTEEITGDDKPGFSANLPKEWGGYTTLHLAGL
jgi:hypothetical protein